VIAPVSGTCDARFGAVREEFSRNFSERGEVGAGVCVIAGGRVVVDLVGGWADEARRRPWHPDTLVDVYSVGKPLVALLALQLVDRGVVGLDEPITSVWPEFGRGGKESATLRHGLCHRAGVPAIREPLTNRDLWDWDRMAGALAATDAWWVPGTRHAYHTTPTDIWSGRSSGARAGRAAARGSGRRRPRWARTCGLASRGRSSTGAPR
jgi:CubicO group peptidase (beta-lactamase class C family)